MMQIATKSKRHLNFAQRVIGKLAARALKYSGIPLRDPALVELFGPGRASLAGVNVDEWTCNTASAYFSGVQLISNTIAMLPIECCRKTPKGVIVDEEHRVTQLFRKGVNPLLSGFDLKQMMTDHAITWGNGYAWIERAGNFQGVNSGPPVGLWHLMPNQMQPYYEKDGRRVFEFTAIHPGEKSTTYEDYEILQLPGYGYDGLAGVSVVRFAEESLGLSLAAERYGASHFGNNAVPGGVIQHPMDLSDVAEERVAEEFEKKLKGPSRTRRIVVLDEGMKYIPIGIPPEDSQFLQTREFQVVEIARWLRIPPHMLYYMLAATNNNVEQQSLEFLVYTLAPWLDKWAEQIKRKLLTVAEWDSHIVRFDMSPLIKMDVKTRFEMYNTGKNLGVYTLNDILRKEGMELIDKPYGDERTVPSTMNTLGATPGNTVPIADVQACLALLGTIKGLTRELACQIIKATLPSSTTELESSIIQVLEANGTISKIRMPL